MKAYLVSEALHNFERNGKDPLKSMDLGNQRSEVFNYKSLEAKYDSLNSRSDKIDFLVEITGKSDMSIESKMKNLSGLRDILMDGTEYEFNCAGHDIIRDLFKDEHGLMRESNNNFERNQEPLKSMGIGMNVLKDKFIGMFPKSSDFNSRWEDIKEIIKDPTTKIVFKPHPKIKDKIEITLSLPEHKMNPFFFDGIRGIIDSHSPKVLYIQSINTKKIVLTYYNYA